ncbi:hypothetical protein C0J52_23298 [Blattella germanica]|nr:hypothetical protein C0J52_23298 [Blattella germanica]
MLTQVALDNDTNIATWPGMPFMWFACHWLAMSHSCYNPVIYCWMNARFRAGFCMAVDHIPCLRRLIPVTTRHRHSNSSSVAGIALTGVDPTESSVLHRVNTCTTYISMRRKNQHMSNNCSTPPRSASVHLRTCPPTAYYNGHRRLSRLDSYPEDNI